MLDATIECWLKGSVLIRSNTALVGRLDGPVPGRLGSTLGGWLDGSVLGRSDPARGSGLDGAVPARLDAK